MIKNIIMSPVGILLHSLRVSAFSLILTVSFILPGFTSFAVVTTHDLESSYEGYSIEKIPGTNEFVVAGTFFVDGLLQPYTGYHFMHLDYNGNVLNSRYVFPDPQGMPSATWELRVVDIVVEDNDNFWIVMAVRDNANLIDFAYAEKVSLSSGTISPILPNQLTIGNPDPAYPNLYPTHGVYVMGYLFICGYVSSQSVSGNAPTVTSLYKQGMMSSTDVTTQGNITTLALWDTYPGPGSNFDYDMALKIVSNGDYLFVTGAGNSGNTPFQASGAIYIPFTYPNLNLPGTATPTVSWLAAPQPQQPHGIFGIDFMLKNGRALLLTNRFESGALVTWGVASLDFATGLASTTVPSYAYRSSASHSDWIKQFLPHPSDPDNNNVSLVGEVVREYPTCSTPPPFIPPSFINVNPFVVDCDILWDAAGGINMPIFNQIIHASNDASSTSATTLNYLLDPGLTPAERMLENKTRLTTFACRYEDNTPDEIAFIYPKRCDSMTFLNTKFMRTDGVGHEHDCANEWNCQSTVSTIMMNSSAFPYAKTFASNPQLDLLKRRVISVVHDDCQNGAYKTTGINKTEQSREWSIYPNPAISELSVDPGITNGIYQFTLTDITGKQVLSHSGTASGKPFKVSLQGISTGVYIASFADDKSVSTQKLVIE